MSNLIHFFAVCLCYISIDIVGMGYTMADSKAAFDQASFKTTEAIIRWRGKRQENALHHFARLNDTGSIDWAFKERHFEVDSVDSQGYTPLYWAVTYEAVKAAQCLLEHGADIEKVVEGCNQNGIIWMYRYLYGALEPGVSVEDQVRKICVFKSNGAWYADWRAIFMPRAAKKLVDLVNSAANTQQMAGYAMYHMMRRNNKLLLKTLLRISPQVASWVDSDENTMSHCAALFNNCAVIKILNAQGILHETHKNKQDKTYQEMREEYVKFHKYKLLCRKNNLVFEKEPIFSAD